MAIRSRDFVGIVEEIKSHELSTKGKIEQLNGRISELSGRKSSLNGTISYLEAAIAAAYEDTDEDGDPDYGLIASLEAEKGSAENELSGVEQDLDSTGGELEQSENELESVLEEKAQTLFEIQERARTMSKNIALAGGMYGAYSGVGGSLQNSMQTSLSALSQAASILGGSVDGNGFVGSGNATSGAGNSASLTGSNPQSELSTSPLAAFAGGETGEESVTATNPPASQFSSGQTENSTPGTLPNFHSGQTTINAQKPQNFISEQATNAYIVSSLTDTSDDANSNGSNDLNFQSNQESHELEESFRPDLEKKRKWAQQYQVGFTPIPSGSSDTDSGSSDSNAPDRGERELADELERGFILSTLSSKSDRNSKTKSQPDITVQSASDRRKEFEQRLKVNVSPISLSSGSSSSDSDDEQRVRERTRSDISDYERGLLTIFGLTHLSQGSSGTGGISSYEPMSPPRNQILAGKGVQPSQNLHRIIGARSLSKTTQGWEKDGEGNLTYNSPIETGQKLDFHQGKVENFGGTCGLCSCENVLRMAGVSVSEADIVRYASTTYEDANNSFVASLTGRTLCRTGSAPSSNGGTSAKARKKILEHFGVPSYTATQSIETIADAVSTGHGVIASVHAERLYFKRRPIHADLHAITITSVKKDNTGSILGFYVCDSNAFALGGTGATYYTAEEIEEALSERECNITSTIIR